MNIRWATTTVLVASALAVSGCATPTDQEAVTVSRIVDADTFAVGERRIRPLGIDSCETNTPGGKRANADAAELLRGQVVLAKEPGVDLDRYDRELRYVTVNGQDYGAIMVARDHTSVYGGRNDAAPEYVARLRELDVDGRDCSR